MAVKRMPISLFVAELEAALNRKDGYIMGSKGQNPKKWAKNSWWFTQYDENTTQKKKALHWRENAERVWDCNGLAEGIYQDWSGVDINTKARYNYSGWCSIKGTGMIPAKYRKPGAAVFWGNKATNITHVAYLYKPVIPSIPQGDWYLIEARGVTYGVVKTRLLNRRPNFWGIMDKYFDYGSDYVPAEPTLGERILRNGMEGADVKEMQEALIKLGYSCGSYGADGDFGDATEMALEKFQRDNGLEADGEYGSKSHAAMTNALADKDKPTSSPRYVTIEGGNCYVRTAPNTSGDKLGVAYEGDKLPYQGQTADNGWHLVIFKNQNAWVSGKYGKLES